MQPFSEIQSTSSSRQQRRKALTFSGARVLSGRALSACYSPPSHSYMSWQEKRTLISNQPETCNYSGWLIVWTSSYRKPGTSDDVGVGLILKFFSSSCAMHKRSLTEYLVLIMNEHCAGKNSPFPRVHQRKWKTKTPSLLVQHQLVYFKRRTLAWYHKLKQISISDARVYEGGRGL